jgi:hypothetical protein
MQGHNFLSTNKIKPRSVKIAAVFLFAIVAACGVFVLHKRSSNVASSSVVIPTAYASEIPGWWYQQYFGASVCAKDICKIDSDPDRDGLTNAQEYYYNSNPIKAHTSGGTMNDGEMVAKNFDPSKKGNVTFTQAASNDEIVGESLAYGQDAQTMISQITDTSKAPIPDVSDIAVKISSNNSKQAITEYLNQTNNIYKQYLPDNIDIATLISTQDPTGVADLISRANQMLEAFEKLTVPSEAVQMQKNQYALLRIIPLIVNLPSQTQLGDAADVVSNGWYDNILGYSQLVQRISLNSNALANKYNIKVNADK